MREVHPVWFLLLVFIVPIGQGCSERVLSVADHRDPVEQLPSARDDSEYLLVGPVTDALPATQPTWWWANEDKYTWLTHRTVYVKCRKEYSQAVIDRLNEYGLEFYQIDFDRSSAGYTVVIPRRHSDMWQTILARIPHVSSSILRSYPSADQAQTAGAKTETGVNDSARRGGTPEARVLGTLESPTSQPSSKPSAGAVLSNAAGAEPLAVSEELEYARDNAAKAEAALAGSSPSQNVVARVPKRVWRQRASAFVTERFKDATCRPLRETQDVIRFEISGLRNHVLRGEKFWEKLIIEIVVFPVVGKTETRFYIVVDGYYGTGLRDQPKDDVYTSMEPRYRDQLVAYTEALGVEMTKQIEGPAYESPSN